MPRPLFHPVEVFTMPCCSGPCAAANHFDSNVARRDLRRYQRHGPDISTRILLSELRRWPLQGLHLLDVGAGIGVIPVELATAVINKRAGGTGLISGRKAFQRPMKEGVQLLNTIQDVYLSPEVTVA